MSEMLSLPSYLPFNGDKLEIVMTYLKNIILFPSITCLGSTAKMAINKNSTDMTFKNLFL